MEAEAEGANSNSSRRITRSATATKKKRKPLSDLTNLIPSSTIHKPAIPIPKPYNSNFKPHKPGLNPSKSDSSIGSSNYNNNNNNNKNAPNPSTLPSTPHSSFVVPESQPKMEIGTMLSSTGTFKNPLFKFGDSEVLWFRFWQLLFNASFKKGWEEKGCRQGTDRSSKSSTDKKGKLAEDPNKPKRPPSAFFFVFLEEFGTTFKKENPIVKAVSALATNQSFTASTPSEVAHS